MMIKIWHQKHKQQQQNKLDFIKIKTFCAPKNNIENVKRQAKEQENYLQVFHIEGFNIENI